MQCNFLINSFLLVTTTSENPTGHGLGTGLFENKMTFFFAFFATNISIDAPKLGSGNTTKTSVFLYSQDHA